MPSGCGSGDPGEGRFGQSVGLGRCPWVHGDQGSGVRGVSGAFPGVRGGRGLVPASQASLGSGREWPDSASSLGHSLSLWVRPWPGGTGIFTPGFPLGWVWPRRPAAPSPAPNLSEQSPWPLGEAGLCRGGPCSRLSPCWRGNTRLCLCPSAGFCVSRACLHAWACVHTCVRVSAGPWVPVRDSAGGCWGCGPGGPAVEGAGRGGGGAGRPLRAWDLAFT